MPESDKDILWMPGVICGVEGGSACISKPHIIVQYGAMKAGLKLFLWLQNILKLLINVMPWVQYVDAIYSG